MKLGIKVNADARSYDRLSGANPDLAEVWFNANDPDRYTDLFAELTRRKCDIGLHFWGTVSGNILPNLSYPDATIVTETMTLMKRTIDIAETRNFQYVNIHPGSSALLSVDFDKERYDIQKPASNLEDAIQRFLTNVSELHAYAQKKGVVFTVETVPLRITDGWYTADTRANPKQVHELPIAAIVQAASAGIPIANDFCHTASSIITDDEANVWRFVHGMTTLLAPMTRLIHIGFVMPPYNGTDNHDQLDNPILETSAAVPNTNQLIELLKLFSDRPDVWILAEPSNNHVKNFIIVKRLMEIAASSEKNSSQ